MGGASIGMRASQSRASTGISTSLPPRCLRPCSRISVANSPAGASEVPISSTQTSSGPSQFKTTQQQYTWQNDFTLPKGALSVALTRREEYLDTDTPFAVTSRNTNAIVGVYQLQDGPNALQANLRRDDSTQFGGQTSGSIAYAYTIGSGLRASASYGTLDVTQAFGPLQVGLQVTASSARFDDAANTRSMGGYAIVNLNAEFALAPHWTLFVVAALVATISVVASLLLREVPLTRQVESMPEGLEAAA